MVRIFDVGYYIFTDAILNPSKTIYLHSNFYDEGSDCFDGDMWEIFFTHRVMVHYLIACTLRQVSEGQRSLIGPLIQHHTTIGTSS